MMKVIMILLMIMLTWTGKKQECIDDDDGVWDHLVVEPNCGINSNWKRTILTMYDYPYIGL